MLTIQYSQTLRNNPKEAFAKPKCGNEERHICVAKKIPPANIVIGEAVLATLGTAALTHVLFDPDSREKMNECTDKFRACGNKKPSDYTEMGDTETA